MIRCEVEAGQRVHWTQPIRVRKAHHVRRDPISAGSLRCLNIKSPVAVATGRKPAQLRAPNRSGEHFHERLVTVPERAP
jgi:hypothetical protein